jgi:hypothetical protein
MKGFVGRLADGMLARLLPRAEAAACGGFWSTCGCRSGILWQKWCNGGCNGIPVYCQPCEDRAIHCGG